jgi:hypothetical protein
MFVRFRQSGHRLHVSLVEARRHDGKVRNHHIASVGSIIIEPTVADRIAFWQRAGERLEALGNRIGPEIDKIEAALHERVPIPSLEERRQLKLENARTEARMFDTVANLYGAAAAQNKALAAAIITMGADSETAAAKGAEHAEQARERIAKIEAGEDVPGGLHKPPTYRQAIAILKAAGLTNAEIAHIRVQYDLIQVISARLGEAAVEKCLFTPQSEVAVEAPGRAVRKFTRKLARLVLADDGDEAG